MPERQRKHSHRYQSIYYSLHYKFNALCGFASSIRYLMHYFKSVGVNVDLLSNNNCFFVEIYSIFAQVYSNCSTGGFLCPYDFTG